MGGLKGRVVGRVRRAVVPHPLVVRGPPHQLLKVTLHTDREGDGQHHADTNVPFKYCTNIKKRFMFYVSVDSTPKGFLA